MRRIPWFPLLWLGALTSCGADEGELGDQYNGRFEYVCTRAGDAVCAEGVGPTGILPKDIALGAEFGVRYSGDAPASSNDVSFAVKVVPASPALIQTVSAERFLALTPGHVALLGRGSNQIVADLIHVRIAPVAHLDLTVDGQPVGALDATSSVTVRAEPFDAGSRPLAGALVYAWASSDPSIFTVQTTEGSAVATLSGLEEGAALLTASAGGVEQSIQVTVGAQP